MARLPDTIVAATKHDTIRTVRELVASISTTAGGLTMAGIDDAILSLETQRAKVDIFARMGDSGAFMVSKQIGDLIFTLRQWRVVLSLRAPKRKDVWVDGKDTLQTLAEDNLGDPNRWPEVAHLNSMQYSTELIGTDRVSIP